MTGGDPLDQEADPHAVARSICLRLLTGRARSRSELAAALAKRAVPGEVATAVLDRFVELGFVDDAAFAHAWVQSRQSGRGLAGRALAQELRTKGVADDVARAAIMTLDPETELAKARDLVRKRLSGLAGVSAEARYRRLSGMLARKGYSGSVTSRAIREALADPLPEMNSE
jgi:regulatory protein